MIRVLHIVNSLAVGGVENIVMNCLRHFQNDKEFQVMALVLGSPQGTIYEKECAERGFDVTYAGYAPFRTKLAILQDIVNWFRCQHYIYKQVRKIKPDIVHTHGTYLLPYTMFVKLCTGVKVHVHKLTNDPYIYGKRIVFCARVALNLLGVYPVCITNVQAQLAQKRYKMKNYALVRNGIEYNRFIQGDRKKVRKSLEIADSTFVIGCVANFFAKKNHQFLVQLFNEYAKQFPNSLLVLVGDGIEHDNIKNLVFELGIDNKCLFLGIRNDVGQLYSAMDFFMLVSFFEGAPSTVLEAQYSGVRCVVSSSIPADVVVTNNVTRVSLDAPRETWFAAMKDEIPHDSPKGTFEDFSIERMCEDMKSLYKAQLNKKCA